MDDVPAASRALSHRFTGDHQQVFGGDFRARAYGYDQGFGAVKSFGVGPVDHLRTSLIFCIVLAGSLGGCAGSPKDPAGDHRETTRALAGANGTFEVPVAPMLSQGDVVWAWILPSSPTQAFNMSGFLGFGAPYHSQPNSCGSIQLDGGSALFSFGTERPVVSSSGGVNGPVVVQNDAGFSFDLNARSEQQRRIPMMFGIQLDSLSAVPDLDSANIVSTAPFTVDVIGNSNVSCIYDLNDFDHGEYHMTRFAKVGRDLSKMWAWSGPSLFDLSYDANIACTVSVISGSREPWTDGGRSGSGCSGHSAFLLKSGPTELDVREFEGSSGTQLLAIHVPIPPEFVERLNATGRFIGLN